jgi:hypothetical protein
MRNLGKPRALKVSIEEGILDLISLKYKVDRRVTEYIAHYPFRYLKRCIQGNELRPIRLRYLGVFYMKKTTNKEKLLNERTSYLGLVGTDIMNKALPEYNDWGDAYNHILELHENKDYVEITRLYKLCKYLEKMSKASNNK